MEQISYIARVILALGWSTCYLNAQNNVILTPVAEDCLRQLPGSPPFVLGWDYGSVFNQSDGEDQTVIDFRLTSIGQSALISSAKLTFFLQSQNSGSLPAPIDISVFYGESSVQAADWNRGQYFGSFPDAYGIQSWDITSAVQSAINAGTDFLDLRLSTTDSQCVAIIDPPERSPRLSLSITIVPEPSAFELLIIGLPFAMRKLVRKKSAKL